MLLLHLELAPVAVIEEEVSAREPVSGGQYGLGLGGRPVRRRRPLIAVSLLTPGVSQ